MNTFYTHISEYCSNITIFTYLFYFRNHFYTLTILENLLYISINSKGESDF